MNQILEIMRTVLDFRKINPNKQQVYEIKRIRDVFKAIEDQEIRGYHEEICVNFHKDFKDAYSEITENYGFQIGFDSDNQLLTDEGLVKYNHTISYFGYPIWVYYNGDKIARFDFTGSMTETPPHENTFSGKWYKSHKWDRFEKIYL